MVSIINSIEPDLPEDPIERNLQLREVQVISLCGVVGVGAEEELEPRVIAWKKLLLRFLDNHCQNAAEREGMSVLCKLCGDTRAALQQT